MVHICQVKNRKTGKKISRVFEQAYYKFGAFYAATKTIK
jgi:hypothetical protein